jgi:hypothetical protein
LLQKASVDHHVARDQKPRTAVWKREGRFNHGGRIEQPTVAVDKAWKAGSIHASPIFPLAASSSEFTRSALNASRREAGNTSLCILASAGPRFSAQRAFSQKCESAKGVQNRSRGGQHAAVALASSGSALRHRETPS